MRQVILGFIFGLALFATQGYFYYIEVFWFFFLGGTIFSLVLGKNKKTWLLFYSSIIILFLSIIVVMFFEDPPEWHLQKGLSFLIMSLGLGIPLWLKQKTPVVKLLLIAGFIGLVFQHQYLLTTPLKIVTLIEDDNPFENLLHLEDSADFVIPEGPFIAFTYNKG